MASSSKSSSSGSSDDDGNCSFSGLSSCASVHDEWEPPPMGSIEVATTMDSGNVADNAAAQDEDAEAFVLGLVAQRAQQARDQLDQQQQDAAASDLATQQDARISDEIEKAKAESFVPTSGVTEQPFAVKKEIPPTNNELAGAFKTDNDTTCPKWESTESAADDPVINVTPQPAVSLPGAVHVSNPLGSSPVADHDDDDEEAQIQPSAAPQVPPVPPPLGLEQSCQVSVTATLVTDEPSEEQENTTGNSPTPLADTTASPERMDCGRLLLSLQPVVEGEAVRPEKENRRHRHCFVRFSLVGIIVMVGVIILMILGLAGVLNGGNDPEDGVPLSRPDTSISSPTLAKIQKEGVLRCAHNVFLASDLYQFEEALCRTMAAAILGDAAKIELVNLPLMSHRFSGLADGEVDVLIRSITHTMERDVSESTTGAAFTFSSPYIYEGMKVAGTKQSVDCVENGFRHIEECTELRVCAFEGGTHHRALMKVLPERYIVPLPLLHTFAEYIANIEAGVCNAVASTPYSLAEKNARENGYKGDYAITKQYFSKDPISMVTRSDDAVFSDFVNSILQALFVAEQHGITKDLAHLFPLTNAALFGNEYDSAFRNAIATNGNFGEMYATCLGNAMPRDALNSLNDGSTGLIYSYPFGMIGHGREDKPLGHRMQGVVDRGVLRCGARFNRPNLATAETKTGMDFEYCFAVAAALFGGNKDAVEFVEVDSSTAGFALLAAGSIDLLAGATHTLQNGVREPTTGIGFAFTQPYFYGRVQEAEEDNSCLATHQDDKDWSSFVFWIVAATFFAEENDINQHLSNSMPEVFVYGDSFKRMFRDTVLAVGNYGEIFQRSGLPRTGRNQLNVNPNLGPQHYALPGFFDP
ncbi:extracellular solute-binding protein [Seminavis robusta]|uniref:Extracellular solute-binding protein n=1 Tax=Seminavis robusta TaxID=568900 RepID=A0A9N8DP33_9STRA|nr:extracellular solute-binding protein [Seminavis robusta]|eukprot:Sro269_g104120.1 extracellular solute-binding protein (869) ;mRNA; r:72443-75239